MTGKHVLSLVLAAVGAAALAIASAEPAAANVLHIIAGLCAAVQPYLAMTSPAAGQAGQ